MRTDYQTGLSDRDRAGLKEFRQFQKDEAERERLAENRGLYQKYVSDLSTQQARVPKGSRVQPLSFESFCTFLPDDEENPELRLLTATNRILECQVWRNTQSEVSGNLTDAALEMVGMDLDDRPEYSGLELHGDDPEALPAIYARFISITPTYHHDWHFDVLAAFFQRNRLCATLTNLRTAFSLLSDLAIVPEKPAPAAPARTPELNRYGVNLTADPGAPDPEVEKQRARKAYHETIVVRDPRDGKGYTAYMLDHATDADTYKRLVLGENFIPCISHVIRGDLK
jgi:hypothetical protein